MGVLASEALCLGIGAIPSVPGAYPGGPALPSLLPARPLGRALQWGILGGQQGHRTAGQVSLVMVQQVLTRNSVL